MTRYRLWVACLVLAILWAIFLTGPALFDLIHRGPDLVNPWRSLVGAAGPLIVVLLWKPERRERLTMEQLRLAGDHMATEIEDRWSGPNGCDCKVCSAAKAWRELVGPRP